LKVSGCSFAFGFFPEKKETTSLCHMYAPVHKNSKKLENQGESSIMSKKQQQQGVGDPRRFLLVHYSLCDFYATLSISVFLNLKNWTLNNYLV